MKVLRLHASADLRLHDEPEPIPNLGEELIHVKAVGICGSDLHWFSQGGIGDSQLVRPLVLGHEFAGITGSGQRVAVDPAVECGQCEFCQQGHPNLCERMTFAGHGAQDGAFREQIPWDNKHLYPIPDSLTYCDGVMLEPLGVAMHAVNLAHLKIGMTVGVAGCGPIGLLIIQLAKLSGVKTVFATEKLTHRLEAARASGAQHTFQAQDGAECSEIMKATGGRGLDVVFEAAGEQEAVDTSFHVVVPGGKVILAGIPDSDQTSFTASEARRKGLTIKMVRRMKHTYPKAIELVESGLVDVRSLVTHRFPLEKAAEAFEVASRREGIKIIVEI